MSGPKILLVDDNPTALSTLQTALTLNGFEVDALIRKVREILDLSLPN